MQLFGKRNQKPDIPALTANRDISGLIRVLTSDNFDDQAAAAKAIQSLGHPAVEILISRLKTRDRTLRLGLIGALAEIKDPLAVEPLIEALDDADPEVRWAGAIALGGIGDDLAVPGLKKALSDPDKYVRYGASFALARIGWKPDTPLDKALLFFGMQEWGALKEMGSSAIDVLETARKDKDVRIRIKAVELLGEIPGGVVTKSLVGALADENSEVRWKSVLVSEKAGVPLIYLPRGLSRRPRIRKNPQIAALLNFLLPGQGYNYLGKWWGILIFQLDVTITLWLLRFGGESLSYTILIPIYLIIAAHAAYIAMKMPDM